MSALNPVMTIGAQFAEHFAHLGVPAGQRRDRIVAALSDVHLPGARTGCCRDTRTRFPAASASVS